ncbi:Na+/H+ antiporter NhaC family protein [Coraliomargarita akajimensis]|uniref:Na+/H+ antiporter NhaC-like protein n=1 Tax=Coraliomargarita akajimensis (strain DSM 45221 / IAM 15411 / JCM 23193 / KCTC 12865 / 04OKA010-24) TaxID=583355 RepID=D5EN29_CORAD|nr:Na+/H+ antiporter NhaC family protein [Coraliomargarita akajimensis]ADE53464.1 Na+/H+ antiporter NhaC-like protein [Coraliomargarita akajimensis DSM 45221]
MGKTRVHVLLSLICLLLLSILFSGLSRAEHLWLTLWPSSVALLVVLVARSAWIGLLSGAIAGSLLIHGNPLDGLVAFLSHQLLPIFTSPWKLSAIAFTLILGGFVALIEAGGGLQALVRKLLGAGSAPAKRMQFTVLGFGLLVFFDGLANTMLIGRLLRSAADRSGVSRVKLAYLADATGSAVACLAFISTWIAFQLSMIREGLDAVGMEASAYHLFFKSIPTNFYCWFALVMVFVCIVREFNPGPMARYEREARAAKSAPAARLETVPSRKETAWWKALIPIAVLALSIPLISYWIGADEPWPFSLAKFSGAYAIAEAHVPSILVASSVVAAVVAAFFYRPMKAAPGRARVFGGGVRELIAPIGILICAWLLGAVIAELGAAEVLSLLLSGQVPLWVLPMVIFVLGAVISFSTGTSWGTMGVLMPLAIPVVFHLAGEGNDLERDRLIVAAIGAVFSGAVFGDHCSPFSDTTIVASIAAGVDPLDHVRTQLPFALITAAAAILLGFLPLGVGFSPWLCLLMGLVALNLISFITPGRYGDTH